MEIIRLNDAGAAVEDVQQRLAKAGLLSEDQVDGVFGPETEQAVRTFCQNAGLPCTGEVDEKTWSMLVDASYSLGDRTLYLRMPYFHGNDVLELQTALGALGFGCKDYDGIFGAHTEAALRKFQFNLALYGDGIAGAQTFTALRNLKHSWQDKPVSKRDEHVGFARAADVLGRNTLCLFGTNEFTRSVASRMSNLSLATNPYSRIVSAELLSVAPDENMMLLHIILPDEKAPKGVPMVQLDDEESLALRMGPAMQAAQKAKKHQFVVQLPCRSWEQAGDERSAQHYAITLLDALCAALS